VSFALALPQRAQANRRVLPEYFNKLLAMKSVRIEAEGALRSAVAWYAAGDDFADALHLANAGIVPFALQLRDRGTLKNH